MDYLYPMELTYSLEEISEVAGNILKTFPEHRCLAFYAEMGSGKTTLIRALCNELSVTDNVSSPTFSIINEYITATGQQVFHMDWYRLKNTADAIEAGVQDILENENSYCFVEWPEIAPDLFTKKVLHIEIKTLTEDTRSLKVY